MFPQVCFQVEVQRCSPRPSTNTGCPLPLHLPQLLPVVTAVNQAVPSQRPEPCSPRMLLPAPCRTLCCAHSTFQAHTRLWCTEHNLAGSAISTPQAQVEEEAAGAVLQPCPRETARMPSLCSPLLGFLTGSEAGAAIPHLWGPEPHPGSWHSLTVLWTLPWSHI